MPDPSLVSLGMQWLVLFCLDFVNKNLNLPPNSLLPGLTDTDIVLAFDIESSCDTMCVIVC